MNLIDLGEPEGGAVTLLDLPAAPGAAGGTKPLSIAVGVLPASPALSALPSPAAAGGGGKPTTPVGRRAAAWPAVDAKKLGVHLLLHFGADINAPSRNNYSPLAQAVDWNSREYQMALAMRGAKHTDNSRRDPEIDADRQGKRARRV